MRIIGKFNVLENNFYACLFSDFNILQLFVFITVYYIYIYPAGSVVGFFRVVFNQALPVRFNSLYNNLAVYNGINCKYTNTGYNMSE